MIPKLTDFTSEELKWMIDVLQPSFDWQESIATYRTGIKGFPPHKEYGIACQWMTKLTEAMQIVKDRETTNQN